MALTMLSSVGALVGADAGADSFRFEPSVSLTETLTNNVNLAPRDSARSDLVTQITPGFTVSESGARARLAGSVYVPVVLYARSGGENNQVYTQANLIGSIEAIEKFFFVDAAASASQQYFSPFGAQPADLSNATRNRYNTQSYSLSPYVRGTAPGDISYELRDANLWTRVSGAPVSLNNAYTNEVTGRINRNPTPVGWSFDYDRTEVTFTSQPKQLTQLGRFRSIYRIDPQLQLFASVGYEDDDYSFSHFRGKTYGVGGTWHPTERTTLDATWEHRFFGSSYLANFTHRTPLSVWNISASRNITNYPQQLATLAGGFDVQTMLNQLFLSNIPDPVQRQIFINQFIRDRGLPGFLTGPLSLFTEQITLQEQASASVGLIGARNSILLAVFYVRQRPITAPGSDVPGLFSTLNNTTQEGVSATWTQNLAAQLIFALSGTISRGRSNADRTAFEGEGKSRQGYVTATLTSPLSRNTSLNGGVRYQAQHVEPGTGYTEAAVFVTIQHTFR